MDVDTFQLLNHKKEEGYNGKTKKEDASNKVKSCSITDHYSVIAAGIFFVTTRFGRTSYASVNKSMGEYMVKANDDLLGKGTDKELKKSILRSKKDR